MTAATLTWWGGDGVTWWGGDLVIRCYSALLLQSSASYSCWYGNTATLPSTQTCTPTYRKCSPSLTEAGWPLGEGLQTDQLLTCFHLQIRQNEYRLYCADACDGSQLCAVFDNWTCVCVCVWWMENYTNGCPVRGNSGSVIVTFWMNKWYLHLQACWPYLYLLYINVFLPVLYESFRYLYPGSWIDGYMSTTLSGPFWMDDSSFYFTSSIFTFVL